MSRMTSKVWYLVAGGLILTALAIAGTGISQYVSTVQEMHRVVMPGKAELVLPAGPSTLYVESRSIVDGKVYQAAEGLSFRCAVTDEAGKQVPIESSSSKVSYSAGDYAGHNMFDVHVDAPGTYVLACEAPSSFAMAVGRGVGTWIAVAVVGGLVPGILGVLMLVVVLVKRSRQKRRAAVPAAAGSEPPPQARAT